MKFLRKFAKFAGIASLGGALLGAIGAVGVYLYIEPSLPSIDSLKDIRFQVPLRVYSTDGALIGEFGQKRRQPLRYDEIPDQIVKAVLSAEDDRFFEHPGVDYQGIIRAVAMLVTTGQKVQGGSTITMQVARNFFLSSEKTYLRKVREILLALKIERELTKEEILALYFNKIYFGNRAYGVASAANVYYGKDIQELDLAQLAMIAGLPKAPSRYNPVVNPERALLRRNYVLRRMRALNFIDDETYNAAVAKGVTASLHGLSIEVEAPYAAELVRAEAVERFGEDAYTAGYKVYTTIDSRLQLAANKALRTALLDYDARHGYRGPENRLDLLITSTQEQWDEALARMPAVADLEPGVVLAVDEREAAVYLEGGRIAWLCWEGMSWASPYTDGNRTGRAPQEAADVLQEGDVIRLHRRGRIWRLAQIPEVEGAMVSLRPKDGAIKSVVGGYDFFRSKFNRATQARRQPGSNFKPFVYSAALEKGYTAASLINDAPVVFDDPGLEDTWRPENYSGRFFGPTRLRQALVKSRNLVSIRLLRSIGVGYAINYVQRFGFDRQHLPRDLSLALGSATATPLEVARGYSVFANGGYLIEPYLITRIEGPEGEVLMEANPAVVCPECEEQAPLSAEQEFAVIPTAMTDATDATAQVLPPTQEEMKPLKLAKRVAEERNVYIMTSFMREVIQRGTGRRALVLGRDDLAGKTGTTNDQRDAWFSGFNSDVVTTAWVGFDKPHPLGDGETGARAALPIWIAYMAEALKGVPETPLVQPPGLVTVRIDPETGLLAGSDFPSAVFETFRVEHAPKQMVEAKSDGDNSQETRRVNIPEQLF